MDNKPLSVISSTTKKANTYHSSTVSADIRYAKKGAKRTRIDPSSGETSPSITEVPRLRSVLSPRTKHPLSESGDCSNCKIGICICRSAKSSENKHGNAWSCRNCGDKFECKNTVMISGKRPFPSYELDADNNSFHEKSKVSKNPGEISSTEMYRTELMVRDKKESLSVLRNMIYGFCEDLSLTLRTAHYGLSVAKAHINYLKSCKPRGRKGGRKKKLSEENQLEVASACLLISCVRFSEGITLKQVSMSTKVHVKDIANRKREIEELIGKDEMSQSKNTYGILTRACKILKLPSEQSNAVHKLVGNAMKLDELQGLHCATVVAGCIYLVVRVAGETYSKKEISNATCVSCHSIRNAYKKLLPSAENLLPEDFKRRLGCDIDILALDRHR